MSGIRNLNLHLLFVIFQYQQSARGYTFKCQHGPAECQGNMVHACAIKHVAQASLLTEYIKCMINDNYDPKAAGSKVKVQPLSNNHN